MRTRSVMATALALALLGAGGWGAAAGPSHATEGAKASPRDLIHFTMMGHMMSDGMMGSCPMMGQLPPGNEKPLMQMHGEVMQAMGETLRKYADEIQTLSSK